jgi:hypothetical protein
MASFKPYPSTAGIIGKDATERGVSAARYREEAARLRSDAERLVTLAQQFEDLAASVERYQFPLVARAPAFVSLLSFYESVA